MPQMWELGTARHQPSQQEDQGEDQGEDHPWGMAGKSPRAEPDLFPGRPPPSQLCLHSPAQGEQKCSSTCFPLQPLVPSSPSSSLHQPGSAPCLCPIPASRELPGLVFHGHTGHPHGGQGFNEHISTALEHSWPPVHPTPASPLARDLTGSAHTHPKPPLPAITGTHTCPGSAAASEPSLGPWGPHPVPAPCQSLAWVVPPA